MMDSTMAEESHREYAREMRTLIDRASQAVHVKERAERHRRKHIKLLTGAFSDIDEDGCMKNVQVLDELTAKQLKPAVSIFCSIIENEVAIGSRVLASFPRDEYRDESQKLLDMYSGIARDMRSRVLPMVDQELALISKLRDTLDLRSLKRYVEVHAEEEKVFAEIYGKAEIELKRSMKISNSVRTAIKKINMFKKENPKTMLAFEISLCMLMTITAFTTAASKSFRLLGLFGKALDRTQVSYDILNWSTDIMDTLHFA